MPPRAYCVVLGSILASVAFSAGPLCAARASAPAPPPKAAPPVQAPARPEVVRFRSEDGVALVADYRTPAAGKPVLVLLHGLGAGRGEWSLFTAALAAKGYGSLAVDARGHGESGGPRYTAFRSPEAWLALEKDVDAAVDFLAKKKGLSSGRIALGGASMGANIAIRAAARLKPPFALLFSPGIDYQGVEAQPGLVGFGGPVVLAAAADDAYAATSCMALKPLLRDRRSRMLRAASGHGARMFEGPANQPFVRELLKAIDALSAGAGKP